MTGRTTHRTVHFKAPFTLKGVDEVQAAGDYEIDEDEELIDGLSWLAYRRVATFIKVPIGRANSNGVRLLTIDPDDLENALQRDRDIHA